MLEVLTIIGFIAFIIGYFLRRPYIMKTWKHGAPYQGMDPDVVERLMEVAKVKKGEVFYELGSGDGRVVISAALRGAKVVGIEIDLLRVLYSRLWIYLLRLHKNATIIHGDLFKVNLSNADVVCLYLLPETCKKLEQKLILELRKGTRVVSVGFEMPDWRPVHIEPRGTVYGPIYLYQT